MILLPAAAYIILHVLGYRYPARFWGVDQFHYYSPALLAAFLAAAWTLRVQGHYLGDSSMWFANMEMLLKGRAESIRWIIGLPVAGLEYVPAHQGLVRPPTPMAG
jgi:hypothetical protein